MIASTVPQAAKRELHLPCQPKKRGLLHADLSDLRLSPLEDTKPAIEEVAVMGSTIAQRT